MYRARLQATSHERGRLHVECALRRATSTLTLTVLFGVGAGVRAALLAAVVCLHVFGKVVGPHEPLVTDGTSEPLLSCMSPQMSLQFVRASEPLTAEQPVTYKGPLARVPPQMRLQMRRLAVHLPAARDVAAVDVLLAEVRARRPEPLGLLTVRTVAGGPAGVAALRARRRSLRGWCGGARPV